MLIGHLKHLWPITLLSQPTIPKQQNISRDLNITPRYDILRMAVGEWLKIKFACPFLSFPKYWLAELTDSLTPSCSIMRNYISFKKKNNKRIDQYFSTTTATPQSSSSTPSTQQQSETHHSDSHSSSSRLSNSEVKGENQNQIWEVFGDCCCWFSAVLEGSLMSAMRYCTGKQPRTAESTVSNVIDFYNLEDIITIYPNKTKNGKAWSDV